jgi:transposase
VIVANARKLKGVTQEEVRNDRRDGEPLAQLAYWSPKLLKGIQHRSGERQRDLTVIQARATLVRARTMITNAACSAESFPNKAMPLLRSELGELIGPMVNQVQALNQQIDKLDQQVEALVQRYPEIRTLRTVPGVGPLVAATYVLTLNEANAVPPNLAVRREHFLDWGRAKSNPATAIRRARSPRAGNSYLRSLLVQSAHYVLGHFAPDSALRPVGTQACGQRRQAW